MCDEVAGIAAAVAFRLPRRHGRDGSHDLPPPGARGRARDRQGDAQRGLANSMRSACASSREQRTGEAIHTSAAYLTMVALDDEAGRPRCQRSSRRRRTSSAERARLSCGATTGSPSASGSRPTGPAARPSRPVPGLLLELAELAEAAAAEGKPDPHEAVAGPAGPVAQPERGEHAVTLVLHLDELATAGQPGVEELRRRAVRQPVELVNERPRGEVGGVVVSPLLLESQQPVPDEPALVGLGPVLAGRTGSHIRRGRRAGLRRR